MATLLPFDGTLPDFGDCLMMAASGLIGGTALLVLISAYRRAPAALVAPFQYSQMLWAILLGLLIWGDLPDPAKLLGGLIVAASGVFVVYRETALGRRPTASLHPNARRPRLEANAAADPGSRAPRRASRRSGRGARPAAPPARPGRRWRAPARPC